MLVSHRVSGAPALEAQVETHALVHTRYRVHVVRNARVVCEDGLFLRTFDRKGHTQRPILTVVLEGRARIRAYGAERWLEAGDVAVTQSKAAIEMRQEGDRYEALTFEWDPGWLADRPSSPLSTARLSPRDVARLRHAAGCVAGLDADPPGIAPVAAGALAVLGACGAGFAPVAAGDLVEPVPPRTRRLSRALDAVLSDLSVGPAGVDLEHEMAMSERQLHRIIGTFNERYGFNSLGWRDTRNRRRLMVGAVLMTAPGASTEAAAEATGYGAPTGLCHAFAHAGLMSPGAVARAVEGLR